MKKSTNQNLAMFRSVIALLKANSQFLETMPGASNNLEKLYNKMDDLEKALLAQQTATVGSQAMKKEFLDDVRRRIVQMKRALQVHGKNTGNIPLILGNRESESMLSKVRPELLYLMARDLEKQVDQYASYLEPFGITEEEIISYKIQMESFVEQINSVRQAITKRKIATSTIMVLEVELKRILRDDIDLYVVFVARTHTNFFLEYKNARRVYGVKARRVDRDPDKSSETQWKMKLQRKAKE